MRLTAPTPTPAPEDIARAREVFERREPRDLFYRAATALVDLALSGKVELRPAEAIAVLLRTWNASYYRFHPGLGLEHFSRLEELIGTRNMSILRFRERLISSLAAADEPEVRALFDQFEDVLGPVGAAKALHLLAPRFFPLWDRRIAAAYGLALGPAGKNASKYWRLAQISREQSETLTASGIEPERVLKALDEYNYCRFTMNWT